MNQIMKHSFEAVSLLTTDNGILEVTIIPAENQPDWIIPSSLILRVEECNEHVWTHTWDEQKVAVFHLLPQDKPVDKIIVLESNTIAHRFALQTAGELRQMKVGISDVKDANLPKHYAQIAIDKNDNNINADHSTLEAVDVQFKENILTSYMFQTVTINDVPYLIADLDKIAHQLMKSSS